MARESFVEKSEFGHLANMRVAIRHGSVRDPISKRGLAFMTARMLLRGAGGRGFMRLSEELETIGGSLSAYSDEEFTHIEGTVLAENIDRFGDLLRLILESPDFDPEELRRAVLKIQGEIRSAFEEPRTLALVAAKKALFAGTSLVSLNRGDEGSLVNIGVEDLRAGWDTHYRADEMVMGLVSPLEDGRANEFLEHHWRGYRPGSAGHSPFPAPNYSASRAIIVEREEMSTAPFYLLAPGVRDCEADAVPMEIANFCLGGDFTSRLMQSLRAEHGWTYGVQSGFEQILSNRASTSVFSIFAFPSAAHFGESLAETLRLYREFVERGLTREEFVFARESLSLSYVFEWETASRRLDGRMRQILGGRPFDTVAEYRKRLSMLKIDEVNSVIRARLPVSPPLLVVVGDPATLEPAIRESAGFDSIEITRIQP